MNRYYKVTDRKTNIVNVFIVVDTLNEFVPGHYDYIKVKNIPSTGGFILFSHECIEHNNINWKFHGNHENIQEIQNYISAFCNVEENENISFYEVKEEDVIIESGI